MTDTKCEDRIDGHLASRIGDLEQIHEAIDNDGGVIDGEIVDADEALDRRDEYALAVDLRTIMIVQISTGGPGDQFEVEVERTEHGWELADAQATYRFLDWFDGATRYTDDADVMAYLQAMVERLPY